MEQETKGKPLRPRILLDVTHEDLAKINNAADKTNTTPRNYVMNSFKFRLFIENLSEGGWTIDLRDSAGNLMLRNVNISFLVKLATADEELRNIFLQPKPQDPS